MAHDSSLCRAWYLSGYQNVCCSSDRIWGLDDHYFYELLRKTAIRSRLNNTISLKPSPMRWFYYPLDILGGSMKWVSKREWDMAYREDPFFERYEWQASQDLEWAWQRTSMIQTIWTRKLCYFKVPCVWAGYAARRIITPRGIVFSAQLSVLKLENSFST